MTITLFAQPYDISATGFYFESAGQYDALAAKAVNDYGQKVEEFEIQFIDGETLDCELAKVWQLHQANIATYLEAAEDWEVHEKESYIIAVGECGYAHDDVASDPSAVDIDIYSVSSLRELAEQFVDEGLFGEVPESFQYYIDYDAIARDLSADYAETTIAGQSLIYRCG